MSDVVYAVHTRTCTYLLDEEGICRWVLSRNGARAEDRCVGAQFVATLDLRAPGGLAGELTIGGAALFVRTEDERFVLIRTKPIEQVEYRGEDAEGAGALMPFVPPDLAAEPPRHAHAAEAPVIPPALDPLPELPRPPGPPRRARPRHDGSDPDLLPSHHREQVVFSPQPAPLPPAPPPHRVILQDPVPHDTAQLEAPPPRWPSPPAYEPAPSPPRRSAPRPPAPEPEPVRTETQPLPALASPVPAGLSWGRGPAWPDFQTPPPPPAVFVPHAPGAALTPPRGIEPSAPELDEEDFLEVEEDGQSYSMEVTLTMPLYRSGSPRRGR